MFSVAYVSSAVKPFSDAELLELLTRSRDANAKQDLTGMLLYKDGNFMQVLEGDETAVRTLMATIGRDRRHRGLITLLQGPLAKRQFPEWSMGFRNLNSADARSTPGYSEFMNTPLTAAEFSSDPTRFQKLLMTFKKSM